MDIPSMYQDLINKRKQAIADQTNANKLQYQSQITEAPDIYNPQRNNAYLVDAQQQRLQRERLANMGLAATGGKSMTLENNRVMDFKKTLGGIDKQQQDYINGLNQKITGLDVQGRYDQSNAEADLLGQQYETLMNDYYRNRDYDYQQQQAAEEKRRFDEQQRIAQEEANFNRAWALYNAKKLTKAQFKAMTGIDVGQVKAKKKNNSVSTGDDYAQKEYTQKILDNYNF